MSKHRRVRPAFYIGDYVEFTEHFVTETSGGQRSTQKVCMSEPLRGWICGAVRRFEGSVENDYDSGVYFAPSGKTKLLWQVRTHITGKPYEVESATILVQQARRMAAVMPPAHPNVEPLQEMYATGSDRWLWNTEAGLKARKAQSEASKTWKRDKRGRWMAA